MRWSGWTHEDGYSMVLWRRAEAMRTVGCVKQWEHLVISSTGGAALGTQPELNRLGAEGWEVVGTAGTDKTIGFNALVLVLKREIVPPAPPSKGTTAEWYDDPCGRWEKRYWDGRTWTAHWS